ncbi:unnamed protein product [Calypogeia fissa]
MGSHNKTSRQIPSVARIEMLLLVLILSLEVMDTEAALWGWLGGNKNPDSEFSGDSAGLQANNAAFELADSSVVLGNNARGKELYEQSTSLMAGPHNCWQKAYGGLRTGCREILNDESKKSRLSLRLTDCFLITSGRNGLRECPISVPVVSCVRVLDDHTHKIFLAFFVDVAAMCHYLQSEEFKLETERAVKLLKDSAHVTQDKLDTMNIHLDAQHSTLMEHTGYIIEAQEILQKGHEALQESIQQGMEKIQETSNHVRSGLEDVHDMQKDVARKHEELADVMANEMSDLQQKSNVLANSLASLYGSVEDMAEKSKLGREQAMKSITDLQELHEDARKQSKLDLQRLSYEALKVYDDYRRWQAQLTGAHEHLAESASRITRNHETILAKQSQVNKVIMEVLDALMAIQKGWIFESRILRSVGFYAVAAVMVFITTSTEKTQSARIGLYVGALTGPIELFN